MWKMVNIYRFRCVYLFYPQVCGYTSIYPNVPFILWVILLGFRPLVLVRMESPGKVVKVVKVSLCTQIHSG